MGNANPIPGIKDKGGRRLGIVRRRLLTLGYRPERRSSQEHRNGRDRRIRNDQGTGSYVRRRMDRYLEFVRTNKGLAYGLLLSVPLWVLIILYIMGKLSF